MARFLHYLEPDVSLETRLVEVASKLKIAVTAKGQIMSFLQPLKEKDQATYEHSIRVGLLAPQIGEFIHLNPKPLFYAGLLHDIGKAQTRLAVLQKTEGWTEADTQEMRGHVMDGYRLVRDKYDFSAEIILWHHRFQPQGYPIERPPPLHEYSEATKIMIPWYGRILSLADTFDALHRVNEKHGPGDLTGEQIKEKMLLFHQDQKILVEGLFDANIFTTKII